MAKLLWVLCVLALCVTVKSASQPDCTSVLLGLADCLSFVQNGSTTTKPQGTCCSGLKTVVKDNPTCLCQAFNGNNNFGIALNMTKALSLPAACGVTTPPVSNCAVAGHPPGAAPAPSPKKSHKKHSHVPVPAPSPLSPTPVAISPSPSASPFIPVAPAGAPTAGSNVAGANAPSPAGVSSATARPVSYAVLFVGLAVAAAAYF